MNYNAKNLPAWVRFRAKPEPKPVFGPPTKLQHMMAETEGAWAERIAQQWNRDSAFIRLHRGEALPATGDTIRVRVW